MAIRGIKVNGISSTITKMRNTKASLSNTSIPLRNTLTDFFAFVQRNFKTEGGSHNLDSGKYGTKWKPLKPSTIKRRTRRKKGKARRGILSGNFMILAESGDLRQRWDFILSRTKGTLKSRTDYSRIHNDGGIGSQGQNIPRRRILPGKKDAGAIAMRNFKKHVKVSIK